MMESKVNIGIVAQGARQRRMELGACPRCGGDVRLIRDTYGAYHQCLQCSREVNPVALTAMSEKTAQPAMPRVEERLTA